MNKAEQVAEGLRLTGFEVVTLPGYSTGVVILDPTEKGRYAEGEEPS